MQDITIRNASLADAPRILEIYAWYVEHTVITFEYDVPSLEEFEGRMRRTMQKYPYLVIERDGRVEGYAYAGPFVGRAAYDWACELTIYLDHDARKHGMIPRARHHRAAEPRGVPAGRGPGRGGAAGVSLADGAREPGDGRVYPHRQG